MCYLCVVEGENVHVDKLYGSLGSLYEQLDLAFNELYEAGYAEGFSDGSKGALGFTSLVQQDEGTDLEHPLVELFERVTFLEEILGRSLFAECELSQSEPYPYKAPADFDDDDDYDNHPFCTNPYCSCRE
jgi:hypothetical protein